MGVLDEAIRDHLELKRRHGASEEEIAREEAEALGPARRDPEVAALEGVFDQTELAEPQPYEEQVGPPPSAEQAVPPGYPEEAQPASPDEPTAVWGPEELTEPNLAEPPETPEEEVVEEERSVGEGVRPEAGTEPPVEEAAVPLAEEQVLEEEAVPLAQEPAIEEGEPSLGGDSSPEEDLPSPADQPPTEIAEPPLAGERDLAEAEPPVPVEAELDQAELPPPVEADLDEGEPPVPVEAELDQAQPPVYEEVQLEEHEPSLDEEPPPRAEPHLPAEEPVVSGPRGQAGEMPPEARPVGLAEELGLIDQPPAREESAAREESPAREEPPARDEPAFEQQAAVPLTEEAAPQEAERGLGQDSGHEEPVPSPVEEPVPSPVEEPPTQVGEPPLGEGAGLEESEPPGAGEAELMESEPVSSEEPLGGERDSLPHAPGPFDGEVFDGEVDDASADYPGHAGAELADPSAAVADRESLEPGPIGHPRSESTLEPSLTTPEESEPMSAGDALIEPLEADSAAGVPPDAVEEELVIHEEAEPPESPASAPALGAAQHAYPEESVVDDDQAVLEEHAAEGDRREVVALEPESSGPGADVLPAEEYKVDEEEVDFAPDSTETQPRSSEAGAAPDFDFDN